MLKDFHVFFVNLAHDDENDPQETLVEYLQSISLERRVECLRYLMVEYENGQLDTLHQFRYENDTFMLLPNALSKLHNELPDELSERAFEPDFQGVIDATIEKVRAVLEDYVPEALVKAEMQLASISASYSSPLQQARSILELAEKATTPAYVAVPPTTSLSPSKAPQNGRKEIADLPHKDAAMFLKISPSKLHKLKDRVKHYKRPDSTTKWYRIKDLEEYVNKAYDKAAPTEADPTEPVQPVRYTRKRKG